MTEWSLSGTTATGAGAATLSTMRERVRVQVEGASGVTEPQVVTASSATLSELRDRVEIKLQDTGNERWSADDLDEFIREALEQYSRRNPNNAIGTIELSSDGREIDISSLSDLLRVDRVWWDYDSSSPGYPPNWRQFQVWSGTLLYIDDATAPSSGDTVRIWYTKPHTIEDLDSATATTVPAEDITYIVVGGAHFAAQSRAVKLSESLNVDKDVVERLSKWAGEQGKNFRYGVRLRPPAWQRYAYAYGQDDLDEAIRLALHRYSEVSPDRTITTVTLAADGREVDISSITDYFQIERVWWDYDSDDPGHPPNWRNFELWSGDILWINDGNEPQTGDVVRIWYTRLHSLNGLDGASTTSFGDDVETLVVVGASGYAAQERVQEKETRWVPRKLREWAEARLREFEAGLKRVASRAAARASGIAQGPVLDEWDEEGDGWW